jgi:hypothetical protein
MRNSTGNVHILYFYLMLYGNRLSEFAKSGTGTVPYHTYEIRDPEKIGIRSTGNNNDVGTHV